MTGNADPKVSIVICTYNRGPLLERCLESVGSQTFKDFEVVVVNGPSTDETEAVLSRHPGIRVVSQEKLRGIGNARNMGVKAASCEIIAFLDDDAVACDSWLATLVGRLEEADVCGVGGIVLTLGTETVQFANGTIDMYGKSVPRMREPQKHYDPDGTVFNNIIGMNSAYRKKAIERIGGFDEYFSYYFEETDLCVRLILAGGRIVHEPGAVIWHEFARSHNRKSTWDQNWYVVAKNTIYFSLKNFGPRMGIYGRLGRPVYWYFKQLFSFVVPFLRGEIAPVLLLRIYRDTTRGFRDGFRAGRALLRGR